MRSILNKSTFKYLAIVAILFFITKAAFAHNGHKGNQDSLLQTTADTVQHPVIEAAAADHLEVSGEKFDHSHEKKITADLGDFPNLHPMIVHFAIVLLIVGAFLQLLNIYFLKKEIAWIACVLTTGGVLAAYLAGGPLHPHTHGLTEHAKLVLEQHDYWAGWTINLGIVGAILQGINLFFLARKRWAVAIVALVLAGAGYSVSLAGHYGSQLVHIEGVGPQGKYLETTDGHSH